MVNAKERIQDISKLPNNWNGNGAKAFDSKLITLAYQFIEKTSINPDVFPTARNSIQFEYHNDGDYLELEIFEDGSIKLYWCNRNQKEESRNVTMDMIDTIIQGFFDKRKGFMKNANCN